MSVTDDYGDKLTLLGPVRETASQPDRSCKDQLDAAEYHLRMTVEFVKLADQKARFLLRIALALFGATFIGLPPSVAAVKGYFATHQFLGIGAFFVVGVLYSICVACMMVAIVKIIGCIRPRLILDGSHSRLFFEAIAEMELDDFRAMMRDLQPEQTLEELSTQIYHNSVIADIKYQRLNEAINWMLGGGVFGIVFALLVIVAVGLVG